jgi:hypothetical protein
MEMDDLRHRKMKIDRVDGVARGFVGSATYKSTVSYPHTGASSCGVAIKHRHFQIGLIFHADCDRPSDRQANKRWRSMSGEWAVSAPLFTVYANHTRTVIGHQNKFDVF